MIRSLQRVTPSTVVRWFRNWWKVRRAGGRSFLWCGIPASIASTNCLALVTVCNCNSYLVPCNTLQGLNEMNLLLLLHVFVIGVRRNQQRKCRPEGVAYQDAYFQQGGVMLQHLLHPQLVRTDIQQGERTGFRRVQSSIHHGNRKVWYLYMCSFSGGE